MSLYVDKPQPLLHAAIASANNTSGISLSTGTACNLSLLSYYQ